MREKERERETSGGYGPRPPGVWDSQGRRKQFSLSPLWPGEPRTGASHHRSVKPKSCWRGGGVFRLPGSAAGLRRCAFNRGRRRRRTTNTCPLTLSLTPPPSRSYPCAPGLDSFFCPVFPFHRSPAWFRNWPFIAFLVLAASSSSPLPRSLAPLRSSPANTTSSAHSPTSAPNNVFATVSCASYDEVNGSRSAPSEGASRRDMG